MFAELLKDLEARYNAREQFDDASTWRLIESIETYDDLVHALEFLSINNDLLPWDESEDDKSPFEYFQVVSLTMRHPAEQLHFRPKSDFAKIAGAMVFAFAST